MIMWFFKGSMGFGASNISLWQFLAYLSRSVERGQIKTTWSLDFSSEYQLHYEYSLEIVILLIRQDLPNPKIKKKQWRQ